MKLLLKHRFDCLSKLDKFSKPLLAITAGRDRIIGAEHSKRLIDAWPSEKIHRVVAQAGHNDIEGFDDYWRFIREFLQDE